MRTVADILATIKQPDDKPLPAPRYIRPLPDNTLCIGLAVESMHKHMTDEGWEIFEGLEHNGYHLSGFGRPDSPSTTHCDGMTDVRDIINHYEPGTVLVQDKREWIGKTSGSGFDNRETFTNVDHLAQRSDIFKLTIVKDAHKDQALHRQSAEEMGCHAWVTYYHPDIVCKQSPHIRREHLIRTYHTVNPDTVPEYSTDREGCLLSGAMSWCYPLRVRLRQSLEHLPNTHLMRHPGYGRRACHTPKYLKTLSQFKVAICTSSMFGYALRKIIEAVACGCVVITDLPSDDVLPFIDDALIRVDPDCSIPCIRSLIKMCLDQYDPNRQEHYVKLALKHYDYRVMTKNLADQINSLRKIY